MELLDIKDDPCAWRVSSFLIAILNRALPRESVAVSIRSALAAELVLLLAGTRIMRTKLARARLMPLEAVSSVSFLRIGEPFIPAPETMPGFIYEDQGAGGICLVANPDMSAVIGPGSPIAFWTAWTEHEPVAELLKPAGAPTEDGPAWARMPEFAAELALDITLRTVCDQLARAAAGLGHSEEHWLSLFAHFYGMAPRADFREVIRAEALKDRVRRAGRGAETEVGA